MSLKPKIVFFGTGPVSLATLEGIVGAFDIEAVITRPDRLIHDRPVPHPVKTSAEEHEIKVLTADNKAELEAVVSQSSFDAQLGLVVDFGIIISQATIDSFDRGILNSHFSLLPQWRGADPITPAILSGATETGVTVMMVEAGLDEGPILAQESYKLNGHETIDELTNGLVKLSNQLLIETIPAYLAGDITPRPQSGTPTFTRKLTKADGRIDWTKPAIRIEREIRGFLGWPGSYGRILDTDVMITAASVASNTGQAGQAFRTDDKRLAVYCSQGTLVIDRLKPAGKREMTGQEFLAGRTL